MRIKNIKDAKINLAIANDYYNRNPVFLNYQALQNAKKILKQKQFNQSITSKQ